MSIITKNHLVVLSLLIFMSGATFAEDINLQLMKKARYSAIAKLPQSLFSMNQKKKYLGKAIFFDVNLSQPSGQSCGSCHAAKTAFADPDQSSPVSAGVHDDRFGSRNTPTAMYTKFVPPLHYDEEEELWLGGLFLDGRAKDLKDQAKQPFVNIVEMANPDAASVVNKLQQAAYSPLFKAVYGKDIFDEKDKAFDAIADAITAFEKTRRFSPFTSKFDYYLAGRARLTPEEKLGLEVFEAEDKGNCAACHPARPTEDGQMPFFTDFSYDNLGLPKNTDSPFLYQDLAFNPDGISFLDLGLGAVVNDPAENGKFRVPTLRNVERTAPYMHNGIFSTLEEVVEFYNTRDTDPDRWGAAEVPETMNQEELGDLQLNAKEINALVAFMKTLSDGYRPYKH